MNQSLYEKQPGLANAGVGFRDDPKFKVQGSKFKVCLISVHGSVGSGQKITPLGVIPRYRVTPLGVIFRCQKSTIT
jgi:hypothetical protein